jgi:hypothetical protein
MLSAEEIKAGAATTVNKKVMGILHGSEQALSVGSEVYMDQIVRTDDESSTQLQLLDRTGISIGSKSEIVLDRFVFDPDRPKGDVALYATRGVFRFVTGTQDSSSYHIKTPIATIGVRGTIIEFNITPEIFELLLKKGQATALVTATQKNISLEDENVLLTVYPNGQSNTKPWVGHLSLFQARGDVTGALGAPGAGGGGQLARFPSFKPFSLGEGTIHPSSPAGQVLSPSGPTFTFETSTRKLSSPVSP